MAIKKELKLKDISQRGSLETNIVTQPEIRAVVGIDLGDKRSSYCSLDTRGGDLGEGSVATSADALSSCLRARGKCGSLSNAGHTRRG